MLVHLAPLARLARLARLDRLAAVVALVTLGALSTHASGAGLLRPNDETLPPLRVTDHLVDATILDGVARTTVTQTFANDTGRRLEATYVFPLPEEADLTNFQMTFNGKLVEGRVLPAAEAARIYESIVRQAKDPGLIEFIGRRLLQMRVFPIEPGSTTTIKVRYQQICRPVSGMIAYHYPLRTRKTAGQAYGTVRFAVKIDTTTPLKNIWSPTHAVEIVRGADERSATVAYEASRGSLEDDFLLLYGTDSSDLGLSLVAHRATPAVSEMAATDGHFVLMLTPKQLWPEEAYQPQDVVFVVDTSGSMAGDKLEQAKKALAFCIDRLDDRDRFSVVRFSTGFDTAWEGMQAATPQRKAEARAWVEKFTAAGGTNILDTLQHVMGLRRAADDARPFVTVFLTDGRGNRSPEEIMAALGTRGATSGVRVFPFGVGHDVNTKLLDQLSGAFTGRTTYVQPGENLELVLGDFFGVISRPVLTNLRLSLPDVGVTERFPATLGDLYHGQQIIVAGRFARAARGPVRLTASRGGQTVEYVWPDVSFTSTPGADYVGTVWAGRKIAYLVDQIRRHGESSEMVDEILALSQAYGIQTPYSSWLVDPERHGRILTAAPGGGGGWRGAAPASASPERQAQRLRAAGADVALGAAPADAEAFYGDDFGVLDLALAGEAVLEDSGQAANVIARKNAMLRESVTRDDERLDARRLVRRKLGDRWYNRIGSVLVDERLDEDTEIAVVRFGSEAYFELVRHRAELRPALAASTLVVVMLDDTHAVLVSDRTGIEAFSDEQRQAFGLAGR